MYWIRRKINHQLIYIYSIKILKQLGISESVNITSEHILYSKILFYTNAFIVLKDFSSKYYIFNN